MAYTGASAVSMCGICGIVSFYGEEVHTREIRRMNACLFHRGPDDEGIHTEVGLGLGQRRLAVVDLRHSATAPLANEDGTVWVTFNGEIYNYRAVREELRQRGHRFRTATDTEVLVHAYEEYGTDCLEHLSGMFAFAVWDRRRRTLFAARDRFGKKPFVYARTAKGLVFGSTAVAVTTHPWVGRRADHAAIDAYLALQYVPSPSTAFEGVRKLPAAHYLTCTADGALHVERYWRPPAYQPVDAPEEELEELLLQRLREAVGLRMFADVPVGAFLSGGIDSGLIVALMAEHSALPVRTFSIGFHEAAFDERKYARLVAERYGTIHKEYVIEPLMPDVLPKLVAEYGEPFGDSSALPTYYVARNARADVTVALTGDGGDEQFAGYDRYGEIARWQRVDRIPRWARSDLTSVGAAVLERMPPSNRRSRFERGLAMVAGPLSARYALHMTVLKPQEKRVLYTEQFWAMIGKQLTDHEPVSDAYSESEPTEWMMRHDQAHYLPDCLMVKTDVASMAHGLEVRCPLLDVGVSAAAARIPTRLKRTNGQGKIILRRLARRLLPSEVADKPKTGFGVPIAAWFRQGSWYDLLQDQLLSERARQRNLLQPAALAEMVAQHREGKRDWSNRLWSLVFLESWFRQFID
jgi:asparagine synthase (glutamine-hydrolysing)